MTEALYHHDSYLKEFDASVLTHNEELHAVTLDRTAFFPGGGGQPYDMGTLHVGNTVYSVEKVKKIGADIWHILAAFDGLPAVGKEVHGVLDWDRRYNIMRTHTMMHILCGVIYRDYGAHVTGGDMQPLKGRMDFEFEHMSAELISVINAAVNAEVQNTRDIKVAVLPREEAFQIPDLIRTKINLLPPQIKEIRTIEIEGLDLQADGGTHVANTREVGQIKVDDYKSKGKINKRIYVSLTN
ncbi:MAG: alanyl-tRNA editing protein [Anaerolineaceae bacterium]|nr:alanyl-tRNA editing protein [Anaerolineaceae bacterium]